MTNAKPIPPMSDRDLARFWARVEITPTCWNWTGAICVDGYGAFKLGGTMRKPHRIAWVLRYANPSDPSLELHHVCGNTKCVNPSHLRLVDHKEHGKADVNRGKKLKLCAHGHLLTEDNVIRKKNGKTTHRHCRLCYEEHREEHGLTPGTNQFNAPWAAERKVA